MKRSSVYARKRKTSHQSKSLDRLYSEPLPATRTGALYGAFPYPTKISPEAIALFIAAHTKPGATVFDGFAGSGTTGLAAQLCENPSPELRSAAKRLGLDVTWGPRNAVLYELSALGAFIARTLTNPPDPAIFRDAAEKILSVAEAESAWMYRAKDPDGHEGMIRYIVWADRLKCPSCRGEATLWEGCVSQSPAKIASVFSCPSCGKATSIEQVQRLSEKTRDPLNRKYVTQRARSIARVYGRTGKRGWCRPATNDDLALLRKIDKEAIPKCVPNVAVPWGDLYRSGYHQGISHLHHFYTRRNLLVFAHLWELASAYKGGLRDALRFWLLSYNASHATIMTRVVAKAGLRDLVLTSAQPGVLYVSGLPVEKNLINGLRRKLKTVASAFAVTHGRSGRVEIHQASSACVALPANSIDYVFTDPPFGGNIPYAEVNFINEAWLGKFTDRADEAIVSAAQQKRVSDYEELLCACLTEARRILKPSGKASLIFHSATAQVWNALQSAYSSAGFSVERASVLHKTQQSFKQVKSEGAVRGDPVLMLGKKEVARKGRAPSSVWDVAKRIREEAASADDPIEQTAQRLYSRFISHFLTNDQQVPLDADAFYRWHATELMGDMIQRAQA